MVWKETAGEEEPRNTEFRRVLGKGYAFILGQQFNQTAAALTYEELARQQIDTIEGTRADQRPNELERIDGLEDELTGVIDKIKSLPPESFIQKSEEDDVNTPV